MKAELWLRNGLLGMGKGESKVHVRATATVNNLGAGMIDVMHKV